jgi:enterochelin esterase-like enzyme
MKCVSASAFLACVVLLAGVYTRAGDAPPPARPTPPTRAPDAPGTPKLTPAGTKPGQATVLRAEPGVNPPVDVDGDFLIGPDYQPAPELTPVAGVPKGKLVRFTMKSEDSKIYPGITKVPPGEPANYNPPDYRNVPTWPKPYTRLITVYIPANYVAGTPSPFIVVQDGPANETAALPLDNNVLDNLIAQKRIPSLVGIMIQNGGGDAQGSQRGLEYDTMSGLYAEFVQTEVLPLVEKNCGVTLTKDPDARATMGTSSGGIAAFSMAWYHPEWYRRVLSYSGTFVNQAYPFNPETPGGGWEYHRKLIPNSPRKPIRLWMHVGDRDLLNPNMLRDDMHDWVDANNRMAKVLKEKGYHYQYVYALNSGHGDRTVKAQTIAQALEWLWKDYRPKN